MAIDTTVMESVLVSWGQANVISFSPSFRKASPMKISFGTMQEIEIGYARGRAHRVSYVGELGWEIYVSADMAVHVFDTLDAAGAGSCDYAWRSAYLDSCRIEKAFRHFGHDMSSEDHILEAGLVLRPVSASNRDALVTLSAEIPL